MSNTTILIVEDNDSMRDLLKSAMEKAGYSVIEAANGNDALQKAKDNLPELIMLDVILPQKNGFQVTREIRSEEKTKHIPIILLTNLENTSDIEKALSLGATTYLVKSEYSLKEVVQKVEQFLPKKQGVNHGE